MQACGPLTIAWCVESSKRHMNSASLEPRKVEEAEVIDYMFLLRAFFWREDVESYLRCRFQEAG